MSPKSTPFQAGLRVVDILREGIEVKDGRALAAIRHHVLVQPLPGGLPCPYTVYLAPDETGTFLVTCRELPDLLTFGEDEMEALKMAVVTIKDALVRPCSADFPY